MYYTWTILKTIKKKKNIKHFQITKDTKSSKPHTSFFTKKKSKSS